MRTKSRASTTGPMVELGSEVASSATGAAPLMTSPQAGCRRLLCPTCRLCTYSVGIVKAVLKYALLGLLAKESRHGYDLKRAFERLLGGTWPVNIGQIYTTLTRLERDGLVTAETVAQTAVPDRKVYSLTAAGHEALAEWLAEPVSDAVVLKDEVHVKILVHADVDPSDVSALIWRQRASHLRMLAELEHDREAAGDDPATRLVFEGAMLHVEADLRWLDVAERELTRAPTTPRP